MTHENIWRAAAYMISEFGGDAAPQASRYADKLLELGDPDGFQVWTEVKQTIDQLIRQRTQEAAN